MCAAPGCLSCGGLIFKAGKILRQLPQGFRGPGEGANLLVNPGGL